MAPAAACLEIAKLPKDKQLALLVQITLGDTDDDPVLHWGSLVRYEVPPEMVRMQTPRLQEVQNLPTCDPDYPVADTILMLADVAVELDQSADIAERLAARSKQPGDDADIAAALVRLAGRTSNSLAELEVIAPTLEAVKNDLAKNKPNKNDKTLKFPDLASFLVVRSMRVGLPANAAAPFLQDIKTYAIRGQKNMMVSAISRVRALNGMGRAAGATTASPLKHFAPVAFPYRNNPDTQNLAPLFAVDRNGWLSGTGGYGNSELMLKYPVIGSFTFSANIMDGSWGESDVSYGGLRYQPAGWQQTAKVTPLVGAAVVEFPVPSIQQGQPNEEALRITPEATVGLVNGAEYVTDITAASFPWASVSNHMFRTTQLRDIEITGDVVIPREVDLIHPTMRGWGILQLGRSQPDPLLPIGPEQNAEEINQQRQEAVEQLTKSLPEAAWSVKDGELHYKSSSDSNTYDPPSQLQYLRPLLEGERVEFSFWWKTGEIEFRPTINRLRLELHAKGTRPIWMQSSNDLTTKGYIGPAEADKLAERLASDNVPNNEAWNSVKLTRRGEVIEVTLNDKLLCEVPATDNTRFGVLRPDKKDVRVRWMTLTGDWPETLPKNLMESATTGADSE